VPDHIMQTTLAYLDDHLLTVVNEFTARFGDR
jgi:hypothetical protein